MSNIAQIAHVIEARGVSKTYRAGAQEFRALDQVDLLVPAGAFVAVMGKSGSGKSTLLNLITGIDRPSAGEIRVAGTDLLALDESRLAAWRGRAVGVVFQFFQLLPTLTVLENVALPMDFCRTLPPRAARARARALLHEVGIADQADKLPAALSGGQQQRAAIARALANDPPLIVADEPTGNLDTETAEAVFALLCRLSRSGKAVLMVTHERELAERVDRVVELRDGRVASSSAGAQGTRAASAHV
jgi:putative ABC transport system ATP-binding protein